MIDVEDFEITFVLALMPLQELEMWIEPFLRCYCAWLSSYTARQSLVTLCQTE